MSYSHWKISDLPWASFDASKVDADLLLASKAAALVEFNGNIYADYLCKVFHDDQKFQEDARAWALEEIQHGEALAAWAMRADPAWDFDAAVARFRAGYQINTDVAASVRGSCSGELIARCMVETGTSSYYTALADASSEPVFAAICRKIAADELRHYKLFYDYLQHYLAKEQLGTLHRLKIGLSRIKETEDDELAYAFYAANAGPSSPYDRDFYSHQYMRAAYKFYQPHHVDRVVGMVFKACGLKPHGALHKITSPLARFMMARQQQTLAAARKAA